MRRSISITVRTGSLAATLRRGRVRGWWIAIPLGVFWLGALTVALVVGLRHQPDLAPFTAILYVCAGFFLHAYAVAWRAGSFLWRWVALLGAVSFFAILAFLHADDAGARVVYAGGLVSARPPEPLLFVAVTLNVLNAILLVLHVAFLGQGSRPLTPREAHRLYSGAIDREET